MHNILVTAIGSFSADIVIKKMHQNGCFVVGTDIYPKEWIVDAFNVDKFYKVPMAIDSEKYINCLLDICTHNKIDFIFPLTDPEIDILNAYRDRFEQISAQICMSDHNTICLCRNKQKTEDFLRSTNKCEVINSYDLNTLEKEAITYPIVCKPINGRSSQGLKIFEDSRSFYSFYNQIDPNSYLIQPYIEGNIITVDVVRDRHNNCFAVARRELLRTSIGAGISVQIIRNDILERQCKIITESMNILGCVNFEFIETADGMHYFLECNPRFSGGVEFSVIAGYDFITNHWKCFINSEIDTVAQIKEQFISRKYEEYVTSR